MLKSPTIPPFPATVHFRPVRSAFFVPTNGSDAFIRAATVATTQWGGLHTLIVPTDDQASPCFHWFFRALLDLFEPDLFVDFSDGSDAFRSSVETELRSQFSWRSSLLQAGKTLEMHDHSLHALAAIPDEEMSSRLSGVRKCPIDLLLPMQLCSVKSILVKPRITLTPFQPYGRTSLTRPHRTFGSARLRPVGQTAP